MIDWNPGQKRNLFLIVSSSEQKAEWSGSTKHYCRATSAQQVWDCRDLNTEQMEDKLTVQLKLNLSTSYSFCFFQVFRKRKNRLISWSFLLRLSSLRGLYLGSGDQHLFQRRQPAQDPDLSLPQHRLSFCCGFFFIFSVAKALLVFPKVKDLHRRVLAGQQMKSHTFAKHFPSVSPD